MNSTLQCLYHIKEFTNYIFKNRKTIQKNNGLISTGLLDTFEGLSKQDSFHYYSLQKFLDNLIKKMILLKEVTEMILAIFCLQF